MSATENSRQEDAAARFEIEAVPHFPVLKRLALHLVRNHSEAEDLVQETFAQALNSFERYESGTNCRAWLCKIMFYKRVQWIRRNARYRALGADETQIVSPLLTVLPGEFMSKKMSLALSAMPEKFSRVVWLSEVEEFTYREIAERLDVPMGTVMSRLHRGRQMLRVNFHQFANQCSPARESYNKNRRGFSFR